MTAISAFEYPNEKQIRRHGPAGYSDYESYREWLRDEFSFRCVFCLQREQWSRLRATFHIDHFMPQSIDRELECEYDNLIYVCASCNSIKSDSIVPSPFQFAFGQCVVVHSDGTIESRNPTGELLVDLLRLDDECLTTYRKKWLETFRALISAANVESYEDWMRFPDELPDLSKKKPSSNSRPDGIYQSAFARRSRGELPRTY